MLKIFPLIFLFTSCVFAQENIGSRPSALKSYVAVANDIWTIFYNPAGIASLKDREISFSYIPAQFELKELSKKGLVYYEPSLLVKFGLGIEIFGFSLYKETNFKMSLASDFNFFAFGINLNYNFVSIKDYGSAGALSMDVGAISKPVGFLKFGFVLRNLIAGKIGEAEEKLPKGIEFGIAFLPYDDLIVSAEINKEIYFRESFKYGVEYLLLDFVAIRLGLSNYPTQYSGGVGFRISSFQIDYSINNHQYLGLTHQFTFSAKLGRGK